MAALVPHWLRAWFQPPDITHSRQLVAELQLPDSTAQFVLALRPHGAPEAVVYLLSSLYFSEKAVADVRELIAATQPKAVVALVDLEAIESFREEERVAGESFAVPSSVLGVIREHVERDPNVVPYSSRARVELARSMFGAGAYGDVLEAKESAAKVNANFRYIDFPYRSSLEHLDDPGVSEGGAGERPSGELFRENFVPGGEVQSGGAGNYGATRRATQGLRACATRTPFDELRQWRESSSVALAQMFEQSRSLSVASSAGEGTETSEAPSVNAEAPLENAETSSENEEDHVPEFGIPFLDLFRALYELYQTPALAQAYLHALRVFQCVEKGQEVNPSDLTEACRYRVALEMSRVRMNNFISASARKVPTRSAAEFHNLSYEEKCYALLAQSLQKEAREHGTVVAVVDVNRISGIRQQWNQEIPEDFIPLIDECYISTDEVEEVSFFETLFSRGVMKPDHVEASQEKKAAVVVGAGAAAAVGLAYLPNWAAPLTPIIKFASAKATTLLKIGFLNSKRALALTVAKGLPGASNVVLPIKASAAKSASVSAVKAAITAEKAQAAAQGLVSGLQRQMFNAIRTSFYSAMRGAQNKRFKRGAWVLFGSSVVAGSGMLMYGEEVERSLGSVAYAPTVAKLGRGLHSLSEASHMVGLNWDIVYNEVYNSEKGFLTRLKKRFG
ncbi:hypothetical protein KC19_1G162400 [Ceratodon purpureus]|uniref:Transmembrane protein n=1 Tax=Ceratodon purpureus TaxID=3225 RepID=A0A8T0J8U7_CERPU|nr:hypothetical protein KC19_1G162400 [Ceratodon purpureus]